MLMSIFLNIFPSVITAEDQSSSHLLAVY